MYVFRGEGRGERKFDLIFTGDNPREPANEMFSFEKYENHAISRAARVQRRVETNGRRNCTRNVRTVCGSRARGGVRIGPVRYSREATAARVTQQRGHEGETMRR